MVKTWISHHLDIILLTHLEYCFITVDQQEHKSWTLVYVISKR